MADPYSTEELKKLDLNKLNEIKWILEKVISEIKTDNKAKAINKVQDLLNEMGLSLADVGFSKMEAATDKYQNPSNPDQKWTGKGRQPDWFKDALATGKTRESLEMPTQATTRA